MPRWGLPASRPSPRGKAATAPGSGPHRNVRMFLDLGRSFPPAYPVAASVEETVLDEHALARMLDYGLIAPRLTELYAFSPASPDQPRLTALLDDGVPAHAWPHDGVPAYAWPHADRRIWRVGNTGRHWRAIARASGTRLLREPSPVRPARRRSRR